MEELTQKDCGKWKLTTVDPQERSTLRSGVEICYKGWLIEAKMLIDNPSLHFSK